ncbi:MAG: Rieske 2Fe-2S domain-containing protein, partial [Actinomycetota bacterium]
CGGCSLAGDVIQQADPGPNGLGGGFGATIRVGPTAAIDEALAETGVHYLPEGRAWIVAVPEEWREPLKAATDVALHPGIDAGYTALFQTCPHLGCRVPECVDTGQFECPCHGSHYGPLGEKRGGPAPRGMDRFVTRIEDGELVVDTGNVINGLPIGTDLGGVIEPGCIDLDELAPDE